jgi:cytochrome P450
MGHSFIHNNLEIFENPAKFDPNRWLEDESKELEKYLVAFSAGPRMCLGVKCVHVVLSVIVLQD